MLFGIIAFLACCNDIAFGGSTAPGYGDDMVHGQVFGSGRSPAIMADSFGTSSFPPLGIAEFPSPAPLSVHIFFGQIIGKRFHSRHFLAFERQTGP